jgi:hypothetical protein
MAIPSDKRSVNFDAKNETAIVTVNVEPAAHIVGRNDAHDADGLGAGCVSFHDVFYEVSSCFGRRKKVILNSVR